MAGRVEESRQGSNLLPAHRPGAYEPSLFEAAACVRRPCPHLWMVWKLRVQYFPRFTSLLKAFGESFLNLSVRSNS